MYKLVLVLLFIFALLAGSIRVNVSYGAMEGFDNRTIDVPKVWKKDGHYFVYVFKGSKWASEGGYHGKRDYGTDRKKALKIFKENFPGVDIPDTLLFDGDNRDRSEKSCPFIMNDGNPCGSNACQGTDWSNSNPELSDSCKWNVSNYCYRHAGVDPACECWNTDGQYYDTDFCRAFRKDMDSGDFNKKCKVDMFSIEDHPDMKNYIKKDAIPCFGCEL